MLAYLVEHGHVGLPAHVVEHGHVGVHIVQVVGVGGVVFLCPVDRKWAVKVEDVVFRLGLIVDTVEAHHLNTNKTHKRIQNLRRTRNQTWPTILSDPSKN